MMMTPAITSALIIFSWSFWLLPMGLHQWRHTSRLATATQPATAEAGNLTFATLVAGGSGGQSRRALRFSAGTSLALGAFGLILALLVLSGAISPLSLQALLA